MDYSTLLLEFMDGTLSSTDEMALFNALSSNEELRGEFKHLLAMSSSVHSDVHPFITPTESTRAIFEQLGFTPPGIPVRPVSANPATVGRLRRIFPALASGVAGSLATAGILFAVFGYPGAASSVATGSVANRVNGRSASLERVLSIPRGGDGDNIAASAANSADNLVSSNESHVREVVRYVYVPQSPPSSLQEAQRQSQIGTSEDSNVDSRDDRDHITTSPMLGTGRTSVSRHSSGISTMALPESSTSLFSNLLSFSDEPALTVEIRNTASESFPNATLDPAAGSLLNNKSISLLYALSDNQSVGIEFGQEPFFQRFEARNAGKRYQYEQMPILSWAGAAYRYSLSNMGPFNPFGQFVLGGTRLGVLGKLVVGVNYAPTSSIHITAGIDGSLLSYPVQNTWYSSYKLGLTYGVGFSF